MKFFKNKKHSIICCFVKLIGPLISIYLKIKYGSVHIKIFYKKIFITKT